MRGWLLSLGLAVALAVPALAQTPAERSPLAGVAFPDKPVNLDEDAVYKEFMDAAATDLGRRCQGLEAYGWQFTRGDQARLTAIVNATTAALEKGGYKLAQVKPASITDPNTVAITGDKAKKRLLIVWAPVSDAVILLMCDASAAAPKPKT